MSSFPSLIRRPRRNRQHPIIRRLAQETHLSCDQWIAPLFVTDSLHLQGPISAIPGASRLSLDGLLREVEILLQLGVGAVLLFPVIAQEDKDPLGSLAIRPNQLLQKAVRKVKETYPELLVIVDIALDPFTDHGHDGILHAKTGVDNDQTLITLGKMALLVAEAGADMVAPSDMMDGRVAYIRRSLDEAGWCDVAILSYAAKYASAFYGPFRQALGSGLKQGDKKSYQLNPANRREAILEACLDEEEGADMLLIKPALPYLDVIAELRQTTRLPIGAYQVSGEYAMILAAAEKGWVDAESALIESILSIKRAGADFIVTYAAKQLAKWI